MVSNIVEMANSSEVAGGGRIRPSCKTSGVEETHIAHEEKIKTV